MCIGQLQTDARSTHPPHEDGRQGAESRQVRLQLVQPLQRHRRDSLMMCASARRMSLLIGISKPHFFIKFSQVLTGLYMVFINSSRIRFRPKNFSSEPELNSIYTYIFFLFRSKRKYPAIWPASKNYFLELERCYSQMQITKNNVITFEQCCGSSRKFIGSRILVIEEKKQNPGSQFNLSIHLYIESIKKVYSEIGYRKL